MREKLKEYMNVIFADAERRAPQSEELGELKEEMAQNLCEKYDDLLAAGKSPAAAYNIAVAGVGDIGELLETVCREEEASRGNVRPEPPQSSTPPTKTEPTPTPLTAKETEALRKWRSRSAVLTSIGVALYILCVTPVLFIENVIGVFAMFLMIAAATALMIFNAMSKPKYEDGCVDQTSDMGNRKALRPRRSRAYTVISAILWIMTFVVYLAFTAWTGFWRITWMMFLIAAAIDNIIKAIFDLRR